MRTLAGMQGVFYLLTGFWPLVHLPSFIAVTGPKTDVWLVHTVGLLIAAMGLTFITAARQRTVSVEVRVLAVTAPLCLIGIDVYYVTRGTISEIYLLDAVVEAILVCAWGITWYRFQQSESQAVKDQHFVIQPQHPEPRTK